MKNNWFFKCRAGEQKEKDGGKKPFHPSRIKGMEIVFVFVCVCVCVGVGVCGCRLAQLQVTHQTVF